MNFYVVVGHRQKVIDDLWLGREVCGNCGAETNTYLKRINTIIHCCFIPIVSFTTTHAVVCEGCDGFRKLKRKEYLALMKEQTAKLESGQFPEDVIRKDFEPKKLKMWWKTTQMVLGVALGVTLCFGLITIPAGLALGYFGIRNYLLAKKKQKAYESLPALTQ